jgi:hypothetical protein
MRLEPIAIPEPLLRVENATLQYKTARDLMTATWRVSFDVHGAD